MLAIKVDFPTVAIRFRIWLCVLPLINTVLVLHSNNAITYTIFVNLSSYPVWIIQTFSNAQWVIDLPFGLPDQVL